MTASALPNSVMESIARGTMAPTGEMLGRRETLAPSLQSKMQDSFGTDFSGVRIFRSEAAQSAGLSGAASGNTVALSPDVDLNSHAGQAILGHELSHISAQARGIGSGRGFLNDPGLERQADIQGERAASGMRAIYEGGLDTSWSAPGLTQSHSGMAGQMFTPVSADSGAEGMGGPVQARKSSDNRLDPNKNYVGLLSDEARFNTESDRTRMGMKRGVGLLVQEGRTLAGEDSGFSGVLDALEAYTSVDANSVSEGSYSFLRRSRKTTAENENLNELFNKLRTYINDKQKKLDDGAASPEEINHLDRAETIFHFLRQQKNGDLIVPPDAVQYEDNGLETGGETLGKLFIQRDVNDLPLFPHEPCMNDVRQGRMGDCSMMAGIAAIANMHPEKIREGMRDNGDGTVTVRFFKPLKDDDGNVAEYRPKYFKVKKTVPRVLGIGIDTYARDSLWVQMLERAYAVAGPHLYKATDRPGKSYDELEGTLAETFFCNFLGAAGETDQYSPSTSYGDASNGGRDTSQIVQKLVSDTSTEKTNQIHTDWLHGVYGEDADEPYNPGKNAAERTQLCFLAFGEGLPDLRDHNPESMKKYARLLQLEATRDKFIEFMDEKHPARGDTRFKDTMREGIEDFKSQFPNEPYLAELMNIIEPNYERYDEENTKYDPRTGNYNPVQLNYYETIKQAAEQGKIMAAATTDVQGEAEGRNDEDMDAGLAGQHGYTVLGVEEREANGRTYKFVKVRNTWGDTGRRYFLKEGSNQLEKEEDVSHNAGVFLLELSDFVSNVDSLSIIR